MVREPWDMGLKLYPITWINWDYVQNSYHGMSMITGLIPNQDFVNKAYANEHGSLMTNGFQKSYTTSCAFRSGTTAWPRDWGQRRE